MWHCCSPTTRGVLTAESARRGADVTAGRKSRVQALDIVRERIPSLVQLPELLVAPERAGRGDRDAAIAVMRRRRVHQAGRLGYAVAAPAFWRRRYWSVAPKSGLAEAQDEFDRLANMPATEGGAVVEITLLRLRALLARARGDDDAYRFVVERYHAMAESLGFEGHIAWAKAMINGGE